MHAVKEFIRRTRDIFVQFALDYAKEIGNVLGYGGGLLFLLGFAAEFDPGWIPTNLNQVAGNLGTALTLGAAFLSVASVYAPPNTRPAEKRSKRNGLIFIIMCIAAAIYWSVEKKPSEHIFNGIAMIGTAIALLRLLSQNPNEGQKQ